MYYLVSIMTPKCINVKLLLVTVLFAVAINLVNCEMMKFIKTHLVLNDVEMKEITKISEECKEESKVSDEIFTRVNNGEIPEEREFKCFMSCFVLKFGTLKANGDINMTPLETTVRKKQYDIFDECKNIVHEDVCERVFQIYKCYIEGLKKYNVVL